MESSYRDRVANEKIELDIKIQKLEVFIVSTSSVFESLDEGEKSRLRIQLAVMQAYSQILGERIYNFK